MQITVRAFSRPVTHFCGAVLMMALGAAAPPASAADPDPLSLTKKGKPGALQVSASAPLTLKPESGVWDLSKYDSIYVKVQSTGAAQTDSISEADAAALKAQSTGREAATVWVRAENGETKTAQDNVRTAVVLEPGATKTLRLHLMRRPENPGYEPFAPYFMYFKDINVRDNTVDPAAITGLVVWLEPANSDQHIIVESAVAQGEGAAAPVPFYPFVDKYGQYMHTDWPGKIYEDADFAERMKEEDADMEAHSGPTDWDKWGGWVNGPKQPKTGFFYPKKVDEKWWLIDPDGAVFWSYGPTGVGPGGEGTPVTSRENWFASLPKPEDPLGQYWGSGSKARFKYYQILDYQTYNFGDANAERKYGKNWRTDAADFMHRRLRKWGFNSLGDWGDRTVMLRRKTPYTVDIGFNSPRFEGLPDVFDPQWEAALNDRMEKERGNTANDPWNIGYFVDNELAWGTLPNAAKVTRSLMQSQLAQNTSAAMRTFVKDLQAKYKDIAALNEAWNTIYDSWDLLLPMPDDRNRAFREDAEAFGIKYAEKYFSTVSKAVKKVAPKNLYLGVRFNGHIDVSLIQIAAKYTDVISYNIYDDPGPRLKPYHEKVDKPFIVGEFGVHSDIGQMPWRGSELSQDPKARSRALEDYFKKAINEPSLVGAHFFQFRDQPLTGRPDGEGTLRGLVNVADTPHFDIVETNRQLSFDLYEMRVKK